MKHPLPFLITCSVLLYVAFSMPYRLKAAASTYADSLARTKIPATASCPGIDWATWGNINSSFADGKINSTSGQVTVTIAAGSNIGATDQIYDYPKFAASPVQAPNSRVPKTNWGTGSNARTDVCFSNKVNNPVMLIASLGSNVNNNHVSLQFSAPYIVLYDGGGMTYDNNLGLTGFEGYAIIVFPGEHDCIAITSNNEEVYSNITWGLSPVTSPVTLNLLSSPCGSATLQAVGGNGVTYQWYGGGATPNAATNTAYQSGYYAVAVTDANGCTNYAGRAIALAQAGPQATISGNPIGCAGVILNASAGQSFKWSGGLSPTSQENTFTVSGKYSVVITQADGCVSYAEQEVIVGPPNSLITGNSTGCGSLTLMASGGQTYLWDGGNNPNSASNTFTRSGTYSVLITDAAGCTAKLSKTITIQAPVVAITGETTGCDNVTLTASGATYYLWGGGLTPTNATNTFTKSGTYTLFATDANGCGTQITKTVTVANSGVEITGNTLSCERVTLTASGGTSYSWNGGESPHSAVNTFIVGGLYTVTITTANGCETKLTKTVTISPPYPTLITISDCGSTKITAGGWEKYVWDGGETPIGPTNTFRDNGIYHLTLTDATGCTTTVPVLVNVEPPLNPKVTITSDTQVAVCAGTLIRFTATGIDEGRVPLYEWFRNDTKVGEGKTYSATNLSNGDRITCHLTATRQCTVPPLGTSDPIFVQITPTPTIAFNTEFAALDGKAVQLEPVVTGNIVSYLWSPATGLSDATIKNPLANPDVATLYRLTVVGTSGCETSAEVTVNIAQSMNIPNTFTPNADGVNDVWSLTFMPAFPRAQVTVYSRYGQQVFHSVGYKKPFDGTSGGKQLPAGVYYYIIDLKTEGRKPQTGYITVLR
ncbi:T9SS type B sorting domain-containing protein [Mucilaginibacter psychrotolerans]|uniref:Gliding motility-associated C-terminal domain-containing protein n=1 Tax=Mucilaginibacter psychrotolerans TaxID=1524096 RepID=A0A4Y8S738_9SPHI|nr:gliding motility-associated C-terminal domain-containing protein [Mucilaginibacter psychrotolerans]TFF34829.1 gliding motility-associated C-terminal domain-containing protein [Mucilaginibacter psychrotolerans]